MNRFIDLADFSREDVLELIALAKRLEAHPEPTVLAGKILGLLFFNPSLRTLASFQVGMQRLGGSSFSSRRAKGRGNWKRALEP
jgi:ornithine carbamoyltransferase